jgi:hypothetical protein
MHHARGRTAGRAGKLALRGLATLAVAAIGTGGVAMAAPGGDPGPPEHAQGNGPPATPPAQQGAPAPQGKAKGHAKSAPAAQGGSGHGQARGHAKSDAGSGSTRAIGRGHVKSHRGTGGESSGQGKRSEQGSTHAKAGKATLCHATGSATNPYVEITISANALAAHQRHQDGRDLHPVPAGGCPGGTPQSGGGHDNDHGKVTICHATGSETNPYVLITVDEHALNAHMSHQDGEDIVNPTGECPAATIPTGLGNPPSGMVSPGGELPAAGQPAAGGQPQGGVLGVSEQRGPEAAPGENAVLGANQGAGPDTGVQPTGDAGTSLPFTGLQLLGMAVAGLALGLAGFRLRRSAT